MSKTNNSEPTPPQPPSDEVDLSVDSLLVRHLPQLRAYVRLRMGPELRAKESASDVVQSACREVLQHVDRFQHGGEAGFRQWLFTTAFRMVQKKLAFHRAGKRDGAREQRRGSDFDDNLAAYYRTLSTPSRKLMRQEQIELLESAVSSLSEQHREVVLLSRVVGLPIKDVAKAMGRTEVATRSLLRRALSELAEIMDRG